jgi:hypothetical protein
VRVQGNVKPDTIAIYPATMPGYDTVYIRDNISPVTVTAEEGTVEMFEYDEYKFTVPTVDKLAVEANFADWVATGRSMEVSPSASAYVAVQEQADETIAAMIEDIYNMDMEEIENV